MIFAICDDNKQEIFHLSSLLRSYQQEKKVQFFINSFSNGIELLSSIRNKQYDVLLLDVLMPVMDGLQIAKEIRNANKDVKIIFLASSPDFAVFSYEVQAYNYLLKPITKENLFPILDGILLMKQQPPESLLIKTRASVFCFAFSQIEYLEINSKILYFALTDGTTQKVPGNMVDFESVLLSRSEFIKTHRSYIVNLQWVQSLTPREAITRCGRHLPIARTAYTRVKDTYIKYFYKEES